MRFGAFVVTAETQKNESGLARIASRGPDDSIEAFIFYPALSSPEEMAAEEMAAEVGENYILTEFSQKTHRRSNLIITCSGSGAGPITNTTLWSANTDNYAYAAVGPSQPVVLTGPSGALVTATSGPFTATSGTLVTATSGPFTATSGTLVTATSGPFTVTSGTFVTATSGPLLTATSGRRVAGISPTLVTNDPFSSKSAEVNSLSELIDRFHHSIGRAKNPARLELVALLRKSESQLSALRATMELLVATPYSPGSSGEALDVLSDLGDVALNLVDMSLRQNPPNGTNDEYWYVLIRGLGKAGNLEMVRQFARSPYRALREAAAEALRDLGDEKSLSRIASEDSSQSLRETAQELLCELKDET
jgi:hypothetical protein